MIMHKLVFIIARYKSKLPQFSYDLYVADRLRKTMYVYCVYMYV
jgi:hypothetical protein